MTESKFPTPEEVNIVANAFLKPIKEALTPFIGHVEQNPGGTGRMSSVKITTNTHCLMCNRKCKSVMCKRCVEKHLERERRTPDRGDGR